MSIEILILTIIGIAIITEILSTTAISLFGGILSLPSPVANVWALNVTGTEGPDKLTGTAEKDSIYGYGGDDMISGLDAGDQIRGGKGVDTIHGDKGNDRIRGGSGNDMIFGDDGNDVLIAGRGDDTLTGGPGKDTFNCGVGIDTVTDFNATEGGDILTNSTACENISHSSTSTSASIYPCKVLNRYACPYDNKDGEIKADVNFDVDVGACVTAAHIFRYRAEPEIGWCA